MKYEFITYNSEEEKATINAIPNWFERLFGRKAGIFQLVHRDIGWQSRISQIRYIIWFYEDGIRFNNDGRFPELDDWLRVKYNLDL